MQMPPSPFVILSPSTEFSPQVVESARHCSQSYSSEQGLPAMNGRQLLVHDQDPLVPFFLQVTIPISPAKNKNLDFCQKKRHMTCSHAPQTCQSGFSLNIGKLCIEISE